MGSNAQDKDFTSPMDQVADVVWASHVLNTCNFHVASRAISLNP